jgi:chromosome segregation ATPase
MTAFGNDRQEMGRIAALEATLDAAEKRADDNASAALEIQHFRLDAERALVDCREEVTAFSHSLQERERALADALAAKVTAEADAAVLRLQMGPFMERMIEAEAQVAVLSQIRPSLADDLKSAAREAKRQNMTWWTSLFGEAGATLAALQASRTGEDEQS